MLVAAGFRHIPVVCQLGIHHQFIITPKQFPLCAVVHLYERIADHTVQLSVLHDACAEAKFTVPGAVRPHLHGFLLPTERDAPRFEPPLALIHIA